MPSAKPTPKEKASRSEVQRPRRNAGPVKYTDDDGDELEDGSTSEEADVPESASGEDSKSGSKSKAAPEQDDDSSDENALPLASTRKAPREVCLHVCVHCQ